MSEFESFETVLEWLHALHLEQYSAAFQNAGLTTLHHCCSLTADQLECMGITLPGHQRRILASLIKTHGIGEPQFTQPKKTQCYAQRGYDKVLPGSIPREENSIHQESENRTGETLSPSLRRERETCQKPVPSARQVSRIKEESGDEIEHKPMPRPRQMPPRIRYKGEPDGQKEQPVPKERTKFCTVSVKTSPSAFETTLPPIPPRSTLNCPPLVFTSHPNPTPPNPASACPELKRQAPIAQGKNVSQSVILTNKSADNPGHSSQPLTGHLSMDGGRKSLLVSRIDFPNTNIYSPPLPPKVGLLSNCQPSTSQCIPIRPPTAHR